MLTRSIRFVSDGRGQATSGFALTGAGFHVWDDDAPTAEAWAHELAATRGRDGTPSPAMVSPSHETDPIAARTG